MYSIALRFAEKFAPPEGTIGAHQKIIDEKGFVWYGKMGSVVSDANISKVLDQKNPRILLIHSGGVERYWAYIKAVKKKDLWMRSFPSIIGIFQISLRLGFV